MASQTEIAALKTQLDNPTIAVDRSVFRDRNGLWAKDWTDVVDVFVVAGENAYSITPEQFKSLTKEQQKKIREAPSSPLP